MKAFILRVEKKISGEDPVEDYSVWCTERQAFVELGKYLLKQCDHWGSGSWPDSFKTTLKFLIAHEELKLVRELLHEQARKYTPKNSADRIPNYKIDIIESQFRGSPFE